MMVPIARNVRVKQTFERSFDALESIFDFVGRFFEQAEVSEEHRFAVNFAIEEIFTNIIKYQQGNQNDVLISLELDNDCVRIILVDDDVEAFDPTQSEDVDINAPLEERKAGGLGLHLTRHLVDSIDYEYANRQSRVTMTKRLE